MTLQETQKLLMLIDSLYANWNPKNRQLVSEAWHEVMKDYTYDEIYMSFMQFYKSDTKGFAPVPGQLIVPVEEKKKAAELSEWERCLLSIRGNGITTISEERLEDKDGV